MHVGLVAMAYRRIYQPRHFIVFCFVQIEHFVALLEIETLALK